MKFAPLSIAALAAACAFSSPASAETFDGPYVGVSAGWERGELDRRVTDTVVLDGKAARDAFALGAYAGYNKKVGGQFVIGAELGFSGTVDDKVRAVSLGSPVTVDPRYSFDLSARAGYLVSEKALVYVRGGYANQRIRVTSSAPGAATISDNLDGWQIGGGLEYALTDHISTRLEYRYSDFGRNGAKYDRHQTLVGVSYNF